MTFDLLAPYVNRLEEASSWNWSGNVVNVTGQLIESEGPICSVGDQCEVIDHQGNRFQGEIVGFRGTTALSMLLKAGAGIRYGDTITVSSSRATIKAGEGLLGRVVDADARPIDRLGDLGCLDVCPINAIAPLPLDRVPIRTPLATGIRAIDSMLACGRGQRVGIFGGSGVGKSTLIGMMTRNTEADLTVLALIGERGREVGEFLEALGPEGRKRSVVVVSTSDQSPLLRIRAALAATAIAEYFATIGKNVLLVMDSLTRLAMAQRELGLAAGEPPTTKGYTPSVFNLLARVLERAGNFQSGSITAFYTVLMEGDDQQEIIVDTARSLLDGHIVLDRRLAAQNHYPPIAVLDSISRLMPAVSSDDHMKKAKSVRQLLAAYVRSEDLIRVGAYQKDSDPELDRAIAILPSLNALLQQTPQERAAFDQTLQQLTSLKS